MRSSYFLFCLMINLCQNFQIWKTDKSFEKSKYGGFKIFDFRMMFFLKSFNKTLK